MGARRKPKATPAAGGKKPEPQKVAEGPWYVESAQVAIQDTAGRWYSLETESPAEILGPILQEAQEADHRLSTLVPIEGESTTAYRRKPTDAHLIGFARAGAGFATVADEIRKRWAVQLDPTPTRQYRAELQLDCNHAVFNLWETASELAGWFRGKVGRRKPSRIPELPRALFDQWRGAVGVFTQEATRTIERPLPEPRAALSASRGVVPLDEAESAGKKPAVHKPKKRGPKGPRYDAKNDREILDGWNTWRRNGGKRSVEAFAREKYKATDRKGVRAVVLAIGREKGRLRRKGQNSRDKLPPRQ